MCALFPLLAGSCPISPLALPRRLTDGCLASASALAGSSGTPSALASTISSVAVAVGAAEAYPGAAAAADGRQQRSPMRKRIVNLTAGVQHAADMLPLSATASPEPGGGQQGLPGSGSSSPAAPAAGTAAATAAGGSKSLHVLSGMHSLMASNPALPVGMRSQLRASAPSHSHPPAGSCDK